MRFKLSAAKKVRLIKEVEAGKSVSDVCRHAGISRTLFYRLKKRFKGFKTPSESSFKTVSLKTVSSKKQKEILLIVRKHPEYSTLKISQALGKDKNGKPIVGNHGVHNVLSRLGLATYKKRLEFTGRKRRIPHGG